MSRESNPQLHAASADGAVKLSGAELARYEADGYLVLRGLLGDDDLGRLDGGIAQNIPHNAYAPGKVYPEPAKYTLSEHTACDPTLAYICEHPKVVSAAEAVLGERSFLSAFVIYVRTPGDGGSPAHNDYKRWRPVGSSMNWVFTIAPLTDFDESTGKLLVAPGSHQLNLVVDRGEKTLHRGAPVVPQPGEFIDPKLKRGDLLLMNMYTWHWAPQNVSVRNRIGVFNKYAAINAPPATGYYLQSNKVRDAFTPAGQRLIAAPTDRSLSDCRVLAIRQRDGESEVLVTRTQGESAWRLPGGEGFEEDAIPGWDVGSRIGAATHHLAAQAGIECPWMSYIADYPEGDGLARVYGFSEQGPAQYRSNVLERVQLMPGWEHQWLGREGLPALGAGNDYVEDALSIWHDNDVVRGKGLTQAQSKVDQYAL